MEVIFIAGTGTVEFNGGAQNLGAGSITYNNLTLSGVGTKIFGAKTTINETIWIADGVVANLTADLVHTAKSIKLAAAVGNGGSWGSSMSNAINKNNTFFVTNNGIINVGPTIVINANTLPALTTIYGTPSQPNTFILSGTAMLEGIVITPTSEFEVSKDKVTFSNTVTIGKDGVITDTTIFVRLKKATGAGSYSLGKVTLTSQGTTTINIPIATSTVTKAELTVTANNLEKSYGEENPIPTFKYVGFVNEENEAILTKVPVITTIAVKGSAVGTYSITASGAEAANYYFTYTPNSILKVLALTDANLGNLTISNGPLLPVFEEGTFAYNTANVRYDVTSVTVTPVTKDPNSTIKVNGIDVVSGTSSGEILLKVGENIITTRVLAQDGITYKEYTITVIREAGSKNASLTDLAISEGILSPAFAEGIKDYIDKVPNDVKTIIVTPATTDPTAIITIDGKVIPSGTPTEEIPLQIGENKITTIVTAQDGTIQTYTVIVTREPSHDSNLTNLTISEGVLSPAFAEGITDYLAKVQNDVKTITVTPATTDPTATITVNGREVPSGIATGEIPLQIGENKITTVVTAQDGTIQIYTVIVTRVDAEASDNAGLLDIIVSDGILSPVFNTDTKDYRVDVPNVTDSIIINPKPIDPDSTVEMIVNGITITDNTAPIPLNVGDNVITVVVTAPDGTKETYTVIVNRADAAPQSIIPSNIITPNGDGKNDYWEIAGLDSYPNNSVKVFDRAARLVYSKNNYNNDWDGTYKGSPLSEDTYYYLIDLGSGSPKIKGFITIIRN